MAPAVGAPVSDKPQSPEPAHPNGKGPHNEPEQNIRAPIGPSPIDETAIAGITANGQVTAIAIHPANPNIIYIGTAWGRVWLTRGGGAAQPT